MHHMNTPHTQAHADTARKSVRVTVPVSQHVLESFQRLAAVQGISVGKAMGDWLSDTVDAVHSLTSVLEKARTAPRLAALELNAYALGIADMTAELIDTVRAKEGGSARSGTLTPPPSNTGGKVPQKPKKTTEPKPGISSKSGRKGLQ